MDPYLSPQLGGLGNTLGPVLGNPNMLAQAAAARQQPRAMLSGPATGAELAQNLGMVPGLGLLGVGGDISQYIDRPETRGWLPYALTAASAIPFLGGLMKMAGPLPKGVLRSQAGAIAYHGSPHKFDSFDASKIGTGEGAQAFGHGIYFAENPSVAKSYMTAGQSVVPQEVKYGGKNADQWYQHFSKQMERSPNDEMAKAGTYFWEHVASRQHPQAAINNALLDGSDWPALKKYAESIDIKKFSGIPPTTLYKTDIPDEWIPKMLDWDKPLSQQSENVRKALDASGLRFPPNASGKQIHDAFAARAVSNLDPSLRGNARANQVAASSELAKIGIPGIRYLDGGSRAGGQGTSNYVVFPGMEKQVKILSRE
jgi:hypothetical protein